MQLIPVLDLLHGVAVRGVGGRRETYRPLISRLVRGHAPQDVAAAFRRVLNSPTLYLADLDAILTSQPNLAVYRSLLEGGADLWLDAGVRVPDEVRRYVDLGVPTVIIGLETWEHPGTLSEAIACAGASRLVFSLDLQDRHHLGNATWPEDIGGVMEAVVAAGFERMIVLDLADVGRGTGSSTQTLCRRIRTEFPAVTLIAGGGVRGPEDIDHWRDQGVAGLLIASALHDGAV